MSRNHFLNQILAWAQQCLAVLTFKHTWEKEGRVPNEELADHAVLENTRMVEEVAETPATSGRLKSVLGFGSKKDKPTTQREIDIQVYGAGSKSKTSERKPNLPADTDSPQDNPFAGTLLETETSSDQETEIVEALEKASEKAFSLKVEKKEITTFPGAPTLLVIDDYEPLREMIARAFRGNNYNVCTAKDGVEGIVRIHENDIDLIITDVQMPKLDGFEMSKMLNVREKTREIPVVFLTEVLDDQTKAIAKRLGAADTLIKPFTMDSLFDSVKHILLTHTRKEVSWLVPQPEASMAPVPPPKEAIAAGGAE
jgi:CheY-like chemotaxis protein